MIACLAFLGMRVALSLAPILQDPMVFQRDTKVPIWDTSKQSRRVSSRFAGQLETSVADARGRWRIHLPTAVGHGRSVALQFPDAQDPRRVRYGWRPLTDADIANADDLPPSMFQIAIESPRRGILGSPESGGATMKWTKLPGIPDNEGFAAPFAGVSHGQLLVGGGANFPRERPWEGGVKVWYCDVFALEKPSGQWRVVGRLPRPLGYGVSASHGNRLVCVGGSDAQRHYADAFALEMVDGRVETKPLPPLPLPMANGCGALIGETLYVAGGQEKPDSVAALNRVFALDLRAKAPVWKEIPGFPGEGRILATSAAFDGAFWVFGGAALKPDAQGKPSRTYLRDAYRFDPKSGWSRVADLPYAVVAAPSPAPTTTEGIFILGGDDGSRVGVDPMTHPGFPRKVLRYDLRTGHWVQAGEMPVGRVTVPTAKWGPLWVLPNGEQRPGVRSPEVWSVRL